MRADPRMKGHDEVVVNASNSVSTHALLTFRGGIQRSSLLDNASFSIYERLIFDRLIMCLSNAESSKPKRLEIGWLI